MIGDARKRNGVASKVTKGRISEGYDRKESRNEKRERGLLILEYFGVNEEYEVWDFQRKCWKGIGPEKESRRKEY